MILSSPPTQPDNVALDMWLRELYSALTSQPVSDKVPATSTSDGVKGQVSADDNYIYYCYQNNHWKRIALVAF